MNTEKRPGFLAGIQALGRGFLLLKTPAIRHFIAIPLFINLLFITAALVLTIGQLDHWLQTLTPAITGHLENNIPWLDTVVDWLRWILLLLLTLILLIVVFYSFTFLANLIACPFNGLLSQKIEASLVAPTQPVLAQSSPVLDVIKAAPKAFLSELHKLKYFAFRAIPLTILLFIPGINILAGLGWFLLSAWIAAIEYSDYPMSNHGLGFAKQNQMLRTNFRFTLGFGMAITVATLIPIINFFVIPAAVAGSTWMWVTYWQANQQKPT